MRSAPTNEKAIRHRNGGEQYRSEEFRAPRSARTLPPQSRENDQTASQWCSVRTASSSDFAGCIVTVHGRIGGKFGASRVSHAIASSFAGPADPDPGALTVLSGLHSTTKLNLKRKERTMMRQPHAFLSQIGLVFGRSFCPLFAIAVIAGAALWGPWVSLAIAALTFTVAMRWL
jgi:hypothetical protein